MGVAVGRLPATLEWPERSDLAERDHSGRGLSVTRSGRRRAWPAQSRVVWLSAPLSAVVVVLVALAPWAWGQQRLS
jgi:hypothetical protein